MKDERNFNLLDYNTFGIDVNCRRFVEYDSVDEAQVIVRSLADEDRPLLILGGGSDLLLTADYPGTVLHSAIKGIVPVEADDTIGVDCQLIRCGSGEIWDDVVAWSLSHNLYGAENLSIIPGEVGASAVQNIGAYGAEAKDLIYDVEAVEISTGNIVHFANADCEYSYRQSRFKHQWRDKYLITHVTYKFSRAFRPNLDYGNIRGALAEKGIDSPTALQVRDTVIEIRNAKLPDHKVQGNAGSFFMNPIVDSATFERLHKEFSNLRYFEIPQADGTMMYKIPAGWMIDQCGWKGKSLGRAAVHDKQALVLVNRGGASGCDIVRLMQTIQHDVKQKFGLNLYPEVNIKP
ncbi:MAG: UDP-N-acetylmuramate dehydrogenase [Prevotella sp.]|nr:UDP-N-acetylmuramate dehydrogenase [Prevotella sp.]